MNILHLDDHPLILFGLERVLRENFQNCNLISELFTGSNITTREDFVYPTTQLSPGMYTVTVITEDNTIAEKIVY